MPSFASVLTVRVSPILPPSIAGLAELARNFWWTWHPTVRLLFVRVDEEKFRAVGRNPVRLLREVDQAKLDAVAADPAFVKSVAEQVALMRSDLAKPTAFPGGDPASGGVAYFSAEFGVHESLPIYSGGLGVLAGDHLKAASDLCLPLVGVGLLYRNGYFEQSLAADGWQQQTYPDHDFDDLAVVRATDAAGKPVSVEVVWAGTTIVVAVWKAMIGRVPLYLLDADVPENTPDDRKLTAKLYGVGSDTRIRQEFILGIGGVRALKALGVKNEIFHMNEGHSAFLALERIRTHIEATDQTFDEARQHVAATNVFTTHTPVPAGIDRFTPDLIFRHFHHYWPKLKLDEEGFLALGREDVFDRKSGFSMAVLAIRLADTCNGVSALHGEVSRGMWNPVWPGVPAQDVPITSVTNGVHTRTWVSPEINELLGTGEPDFARVAALGDAELWQLRNTARARMVAYARSLAKKQNATRTNVPAGVIDRILDPNVLTIGFARRFATYKRGALLLRDAERIKKIINHADRPVQFVFAGKSHPADDEGKRVMQQIVKFSHQPDVRERLLFLENYDMEIARHLVQGVDVWLNNPRRPHEASGTSGMKAAANGIPNLSILDGWWVEAFAATPDAGWAIGNGESLPDAEMEDRLEADALYDLIERDVTPCFYTRNADGIPAAWLKKMRANFTGVAPIFSTHRMVTEYAERLYAPAVKRGRVLAADVFRAAAELAHEKDRLRAGWGGVSVTAVRVNDNGVANVGGRFTVEADIATGKLSPGDLRVEVLLDPSSAKPLPMTAAPDQDGRTTFSVTLDARESGRHRVGIRVVPAVANLATPFEPGLIRWA